MPRNISFYKTQAQIRDRSKTVTRRLGWQRLQVGTILQACEKCQGLKKGEKIQKICQIKVTKVNRERLQTIEATDVAAEGFPEWTVPDFVEFFCEEMKVSPADFVTRIEFEYV